MTKQKSPLGTICAKNDIIIGLCYLAAYFLVYGYIILRFGLNQDEILDFRGEASDSYLAAGRWGIVLYKDFFVSGCSPYIAGIVSGIYLAIAFVVQTRLLRLKSLGSLIFFGAVSISAPQYASMLVYSIQIDAVAFGLLLSTVSVAMLSSAPRFSWKEWGLASVLLALALGMYQTILAYFAVLYLAVYLEKKEEGKQPHARDLAWHLLSVAVTAVVIWKGIVLLTQMPGVIDGPTLRTMEDYQQSLVASWKSFPDFSPMEQLRFMGFVGKQFLSCCLGLFYPSGWMVSIVLVPIGMLLVRYFRTRRGISDFLLRSAIVLLIWGLPHLYIIYMVNFQGGRLAPAEPLACACLWGLALRPMNLGYRGIRVICLAALLLLIKSGYNTSAAAWQERIEYEQQSGELRALYNEARAAAKEHGLTFGSYELVVVSRAEIHPTQAKAHWTSRFMVIHWFARYLNLPNMRGLYQGELTSELAHELAQVAPWPATDCCYIRGNRVYIVTDRPTAQQQKLPYSYPIVPYTQQ